jgi:hypothetical protein
MFYNFTSYYRSSGLTSLFGENIGTLELTTDHGEYERIVTDNPCLIRSIRENPWLHFSNLARCDLDLQIFLSF